MLPAILRMIVPAVSGEIASPRWPGRGVSGGCGGGCAAPAGRSRRDAPPAAPVHPPATCVLPHLRMLPAILRMIVPAVSGEIASPRWPGRGVSGGCGGGCAAPAGRSRRDAPPAAPVHPPATCRVVAGADSFGVFPGPLRNGVQWPGGVDEHGAEGALPGAAEGWRGPGTAGQWTGESRAVTANGGTAFRESRSVIRPRVRGGTSRPAVHSGAEHAAARGVLRGRVGIGVGLGRAARPPRPLVGSHRLPDVSRARDTSPPSRRRR